MPTLPFAVVPLALGTLTTGNERSTNPVAHLGEFDSSGMTWRSNGNADLWIKGYFGDGRESNFVSMLAANAQPGTTIRFRKGASFAEVDGASAAYDSGVVPFINPSIVREDGLYHAHLDIAPGTYAYYRIDIGGHVGDFEASALVIGTKITPASWYSPGWQRGVQDMGDIDFTRWGIVDRQDGLIWRTLGMRFGWLSESDYETKFGPLVEKLGKRGVALWCFDPTASVYRQRKTYFGWIRNSPVATHSADTPSGIRYEQEYDILSMF